MSNIKRESQPESDDLAKQMPMPQSQIGRQSQAALRCFLVNQVVPRIEAAVPQVNDIPSASALELRRWELLMDFVSTAMGDLGLVAVSEIKDAEPLPQYKYLRDVLTQLGDILQAAKRYEIPEDLVSNLCNTQERNAEMLVKTGNRLGRNYRFWADRIFESNSAKAA